MSPPSGRTGGPEAASVAGAPPPPAPQRSRPGAAPGRQRGLTAGALPLQGELRLLLLVLHDLRDALLRRRALVSGFQCAVASICILFFRGEGFAGKVCFWAPAGEQKDKPKGIVTARQHATSSRRDCSPGSRPFNRPACPPLRPRRPPSSRDGSGARRASPCPALACPARGVTRERYRHPTSYLT